MKSLALAFLFAVSFEYANAANAFFQKVCISTHFFEKNEHGENENLKFSQAMTQFFAPEVLENIHIKKGPQGLGDCLNRKAPYDIVIIFAHADKSDERTGALFYIEDEKLGELYPTYFIRSLLQTSARRVLIANCDMEKVKQRYKDPRISEKVIWMDASEKDNEPLVYLRNYLNLPESIETQQRFYDELKWLSGN